MATLNSDGSASDTQTQITAAVTGDTVLLPASGSFTWAADVTMPSTKAIILDLNGSTITIQGLGIDFTINAHATGNNRVTNGVWVRGSGHDAYTAPFKVADTQTGAAVIIDNIVFGGNDVLMDINARGAGLMHHCTFNDLDWAQEFIHFLGWGNLDTTGWTNDTGDQLAGSSDLFYIEDCQFNGTGGPNGVSWLQGYYGARFVLRRNQFDWVSIDTHGGGGTGCRWFEIYNNKFDNDVTEPTAQPGFALSCRAGSGVVHHNQMTAGAGHPVRNGFCEEVGGYPGGHNYKPGRGLNETLDPVYVWSNNTITLSINDCDASEVGGGLTLGVDVIATPRPNYTSYTYPHPLTTTSGGGDPPPPSNREHYATTDTGVALYWNSFEPPSGDPAPAVLVLHPGGYKTGNPGPDSVSQAMAAAGFWGLSVEYRLAPPASPMLVSQGHEAPGQDSVLPPDGDKGYYPEQTDDVQTAIRTARADPRCNRLVYCIGGSAGGSHTAFMAATGTADDDMPDLAVIMSCGVSNLADENIWALTCNDSETCPSEAIANYLFIDNSYPAAPSGADLVTAIAASPVTHIHSGMPSMFILCAERDSLGIPTSTGVDINSYEKDGTIGPLEDGSNGLIPKLIAGGYTESNSSVPVAGTYKKWIVPTTQHRHAFQYFTTNANTGTPLGAQDAIITWLLGGPDGTGTPPPPPDENNLLGYRLWVTGGDGTGETPIGPDRLSATISGLEPSTLYTAHLVAFNKFGDSPEATYEFTSNPGGVVTVKTQPRGIYCLLSVPGNLWGDVSTQNFWGYDHIDGCRARTGWAQLEPVEGEYHWDLAGADIDALLMQCSNTGKLLGLSIGAGISTPEWVFDAGAAKIEVTDPKVGFMPPPWDAVFLAKWRNFVRALALHVDNHANLAYISEGGLGQVMETTLAKAEPDLTTWQNQATLDGYPSTAEAWVAGAQAVSDIHMDYFAATAVVATITPPVPPAFGGNDALDTFSAWVKNKYGTRFGFMNAGLNENSGEGYKPNEIIKLYSPNGGPAGFQFGHASQLDEGVIYNQTLVNAVDLRGKYVEIYASNANTANAEFVAYTTAAQAAMLLNS